jgi:hypothetical protein
MADLTTVVNRVLKNLERINGVSPSRGKTATTAFDALSLK